MTARAVLRTATAAEHERVDRLFSRLNLGDRGDYGRFLLAQAVAFLPIEAALDAGGTADILDDWPQRRRAALLRADLAALELDVPEDLRAPVLGDAAAMLGAIYVLEGSRLGAKLLKRDVPASLPRGFLDSSQEHGSWRKLLDKLDRFLYRSDRLDAAVGAAKAVFRSFEAGGLRYLETSEA